MGICMVSSASIQSKFCIRSEDNTYPVSVHYVGTQTGIYFLSINNPYMKNEILDAYVGYNVSRNAN